MDRKCQECDRPIYGRVDKKFCSDACRNSFNNRESREANSMIKKVNRRLARNHKILSNLNPKGKARTTREVLISKGFNFDYFTGIYETRKGGRYYFCYDQGYINLSNNEVALVKKYEDLGKKKSFRPRAS